MMLWRTVQYLYIFQSSTACRSIGQDWECLYKSLPSPTRFGVLRYVFSEFLRYNIKHFWLKTFEIAYNICIASFIIFSQRNRHLHGNILKKYKRTRPHFSVTQRNKNYSTGWIPKLFSQTLLVLLLICSKLVY